ITEPASTPSVAAAIVSSTAKTVSKSREPFDTLAKDEWEPKGIQLEANALLLKYGVRHLQYRQKKKDLEHTI
ncbi:MAG: hypothetical protein GY861_10125, partial [bacterium]|nr:hypothetical protein [bacterium]